MVAEGMSCYEVAGMPGRSPRTVEGWVNDFNETGFSALYDKGRTFIKTRGCLQDQPKRQ